MLSSHSTIPVKNAKKIVFVAPLDWGLGHTTRCIPLVKQFLEADCEVIIGAAGDHAQILKKEFPQLQQVQLKPYNIQLGRKRSTTLLKIFLQIPKIIKAIRAENKWLNKFLQTNKIDIVVADNRYGLHHPAVHCIFITHQLYIKTPLEKYTGRCLQKLHYKYIEKFNECWVPDVQEAGGLAGKLSHPTHLPAIPTHYMGVLSRIKPANPGHQLPLLIILSGPEPQRTLLEQILLDQLKTFPQPSVLVRGLPTETKQLITENGLLQVYNHLSASALASFIASAAVILSRPGYSTIMDVLPLNKKCIFIPTPGQTEQEYLANYLSAKAWCVGAAQKKFNLNHALHQAQNLKLPNFAYLLQQDALNEVVNTCLLMH